MIQSESKIPQWIRSEKRASRDRISIENMLQEMMRMVERRRRRRKKRVFFTSQGSNIKMEGLSFILPPSKGSLKEIYLYTTQRMLDEEEENIICI
jgi:hypothetical protein